MKLKTGVCHLDFRDELPYWLQAIPASRAVRISLRQDVKSRDYEMRESPTAIWARYLLPQKCKQPCLKVVVQNKLVVDWLYAAMNLLALGAVTSIPPAHTLIPSEYSKIQ